MKYPQKSLGYHSDTILWMLNNNPYCRWKHFIDPPLKIPSGSLSPNIHRLLGKGFITKEIIPEELKPVYQITSSGQTELMRRMGNQFEFHELIELEKNKIIQQVSKLDSFFEKFHISDDRIKIEFLSLYNTLIRDSSLSIFSEEKEDRLNILLLYLVINDMMFFTKIDDVLSINEFLKAYDYDPELYVTNTDIQMFIQELVDKERYGIKIFKVPLKKDTIIFFREDSEFGVFLGTIIKKHYRNLNYLKSLNNSEIYESDQDDILEIIMVDLIKKYRVFEEELEEAIFHLAEEYITNLQIELHQKDYYEIEKMQEFFSYSSPFVGYTHAFRPISAEKIDVISIFQRIRENEPRNKRLSTASEFFWDKNFNAALIEVDTYLEIDSTDPEAMILKSRILYELGKYDKALKLLEEKIRNASSTEVFSVVDDLTYKAEILIALNQYDDAIDIINVEIPQIFNEYKKVDKTEFLNENYGEFQLFRLLGRIYYEQEKYLEALTAVEEHLAFQDKFLKEYDEEAIVEGYILKSKILSSWKRERRKISHMFEDAEQELNEIKELESVLEIYPKNQNLLYRYAEVVINIYPLRCFFIIDDLLKIEPVNDKFNHIYKSIPLILSLGILHSQFLFRSYIFIFEILKDTPEGIVIGEIKKKIKEFVTSIEEWKLLIELSDLDVELLLDLFIKAKAFSVDTSNILQLTETANAYKNFQWTLYIINVQEVFILILLRLWRNDWGSSFLLDDLISKLIRKRDDVFYIDAPELAKILINNLIEVGLLTKSMDNFIGINKEKFEIFVRSTELKKVLIIQYPIKELRFVLSDD